MDQNNKTGNTDTLSFVDIVRMFKGKLKLLICVALIGAVIGALAGVLITRNSYVYGGEITFYLVPGDDSQALLPLLRSESFAEKLLLEDNGLPPKAECNTNDYQAALDALKVLEEARELNRELYRKHTVMPLTVAVVEDEYKNYADEYSRIYNLLNIYKSAQSDIIADQPSHLAKIEEYELLLAQAAVKRDAYEKETYNPVMAEKLKIDEEYAISKEALKDAIKDADVKVEKVLAEWREDEEVKAMVSAIQSSVTYGYARISDGEKATDSKDNQNSAFLIVSVNVNGDEETANLIMDKLKTRTPGFVESNIDRIADVTEARCTLLSTHATAEDISEKSITENIIFWTPVSAIAALLLAAAIVVVKGLLPMDLTEKKENKKNRTDN